MIKYAKLSPDRWEEYRDLRLEALQNDPSVFGSSYEEEKSLPEDEWRKRIANALFAVADSTPAGMPVGMIVCVFNRNNKTRHIAHIFGVYVKKDYRNQGIGGRLIERAVSLIKKNTENGEGTEITKIRLAVNPEQKAAVSLYKKHGFEIVGRYKKELRVDGVFYDEFLMEKYL
ncbi:hypothetical protein COY95_02355 [Candidatus Woesearchaeota archaeon CG_4_10_14_0_8_um_filter_47_5]|nr:MAG: hypothetical protein COY95_02355 [Candidatus Woesearchaeota archaeon CG_4_10_14_0_8_um_filter_47_5]